MTAAATTRLIARYYAAFNAQDVEGMLACLGPGFVHDVSQGSRRRGKKLFAEFLAHMNRSYKQTLSNIVIMTDRTGAHAAAEFDLKGKYLVTDPACQRRRSRRYRLRVGAFFDVKGGKIVRVSTHYNMNDWKRQVLGR